LEDNPLYNKHAINAAVRVNRDFGSQSTLGVMGTAREFEGRENRVAAVDGRVRLGDTWNIPFQAATSWTRDRDDNTLTDEAYNVAINRSGRHFSTHLHYVDYGPDFRSALGFVQRSDIRDWHQNIDYTFRPEGDVLIAWGPSFRWQTVTDHTGKRLDWSINPELEWELTRQTGIGVGYVARGERLRPQDFTGLTNDIDFSAWIVGAGIDTEPTNALGLEFGGNWGRTVNFVPPEGELPRLDTVLELEAELTLRPTSAIRIDTEYLYLQLSQRDTGSSIFENHILRTRWNMQFSRQFSVRAIFQFDVVQANTALTSLNTTRNLNTDLLLTYQVNAWTALYAGFNSNFQNLNLFRTTNGSILERTGSALHNDSRQFFLKFSYLLRL
jgi:opacity protein-like surface antigen